MPEGAQLTPQNRNKAIIEEFRVSGGKVGGFFEGADMLLLTTAGARTGRHHTTPVLYLRDADQIAIAASYAGAPNNPAWYHNLIVNPQVTVELGAEKFQATAIPAEGAERDRIFARMRADTPRFADYEARTSRIIPVITLRRVLPGDR
jgi:deazaflavin-dependent oxidoreductase (nitroreductase family)